MTISPAKCLVVDMCFFPESALAETSFCMQYKKVNVGYCGKLSVVRERVLVAVSEGGKRKYRSWKTR